MLGRRVETLYFDFLQFLYHLALAVLVGGTLVLGTAVAPALFRTVRSRSEAGTLFGAVLARFDGYAILALVVLVVTSALKSSFEVTGTPEPRLVARWVILVLLGVGRRRCECRPVRPGRLSNGDHEHRPRAFTWRLVRYRARS